MNHPLKNRYFLIFLSVLLLILGYNRSMAQLNTSQQELIKQYNQKVNEYKSKNQYKDAALYSNKCASIYLAAKEYQNAIDNYLFSVEMNEKIDNHADIKKIYNNIAMIYSEMEQLKNSLKYFEKSLLISRKNNNKKEIAISLMDIASIFMLTKEYDKAITNLNEALKISHDIDDLKNLIACYNLLAQCYKAIGNQTKYEAYYKNYLAYDKVLKEGKNIREVTIEGTDLSSEADNLSSVENDENSDDGAQNNKVIQDSLNEVLLLSKKNNLKSFNEELKKLEYRNIELKNKRFISIFNIGIILLTFLFLFIGLILFILIKKQKYIRKLEKKISEYERI